MPAAGRPNLDWATEEGRNAQHNKRADNEIVLGIPGLSARRRPDLNGVYRLHGNNKRWDCVTGAAPMMPIKASHNPDSVLINDNLDANSSTRRFRIMPHATISETQNTDDRSVTITDNRGKEDVHSLAPGSYQFSAANGVLGICDESRGTRDCWVHTFQGEPPFTVTYTDEGVQKRKILNNESLAFEIE